MTEGSIAWAWWEMTRAYVVTFVYSSGYPAGAGGISDCVQVFDGLRRYAQLLVEDLIGNPFEIDGSQREGLGVHRRIVHCNGHFHIIVVSAGKAFLYVRLDTMWMSVAVEPGSVVQPGGINHERVVAFPMTHRISEISGIG